MADTYPTNDEYAKEVLKSDGGFLGNYARESTFQNKAGPGNILAASKDKKKMKTKSKKGPR